MAAAAGYIGLSVPMGARTVPWVDALSLLRLESQTIWGSKHDRLGSNTIVAITMTYAGRVETLLGEARVTPGASMQTSICRSWLLRPFLGGRIPAGLVMHTRPAALLPPARWNAAEWQQLLDGLEGPWAALAVDQQVVSLAHCARLSDTAAEVGVQTQDSMQGKGLAALVVATWIDQMGASRHLFYSAMEENAASHRVVTKVGGVPLGRIARTFVDSERLATARSR